MCEFMELPKQKASKSQPGREINKQVSEERIVSAIGIAIGNVCGFRRESGRKANIR